MTHAIDDFDRTLEARGARIIQDSIFVRKSEALLFTLT